jgi:formate dehydrogenase major subunit
MVLSTGRRLYHYHTRTQMGRSQGINDLFSEETADISAAAAEAKGIADGEMISVKSRWGEVVVKARVTNQVPEGLVWMAFHFREACANWLTNPVYDSITQTAEYKPCAVRIEKLK